MINQNQNEITNQTFSLNNLVELNFDKTFSEKQTELNGLAQLEDDLFNDKLLADFQLLRLQAAFNNSLRFSAIPEEMDYLKTGLSLIKRQLRILKFQSTMYNMSRSACQFIVGLS